MTRRNGLSTWQSALAPSVAARFDGSRRDGSVAVYCLGLGVEPLSFATDLLTAVIIDAPVFDDLFGNALGSNAEGCILE